jgi:hypothetical protein
MWWRSARDPTRCARSGAGVTGDGRDDALPCGVDHTITLERVLDRAGVTRQVCVAGSGDDPMEDCADDQGIPPYDQDVINGRLVKLGPDP